MPLVALCPRRFLADFIICTSEFDLRQAQVKMIVEWSIVFATLAGPIIAVQTQKFIERASERGKRR